MHDNGDALAFLDDAVGEVHEQDGFAGSRRRGIADLPAALGKQGADVRDTLLLVRAKFHNTHRTFESNVAHTRHGSRTMGSLLSRRRSSTSCSPFLKLYESGAAFARFAFGDERRFLAAKA